VNGEGAHPLWKKLKSSAGKSFITSLGGTEIKWNFSKFLIVDGKEVKRYEPVSAPNSLRGDIDKAIAQAKAAAGSD